MAKKIKEQRVAGKNLLETLTVSMYTDNRIIFREYIQNAADAIDQAVATEILSSRDDGEIKITIDNEKREIKIRDNGIGIPTKEVYHGLGNIGKSQKIHTENRGFRGIGRLGGLAYCQELQFITSYKGEDCKTIMVWDSDELKRYLQPNEGMDMSLIEVVDAITIIDKQSEQADKHYFEVILTGITKGHNNLLDIDDVKAYLSQVAPVPFNCQNFSVLKKVNEKLVELGKEQEEFNIYLDDDKGESEQIYKPYKRQVFIDYKKKNIKNDLIQDIEFFEGYKKEDELLFLGWYSIRKELSVIIKDDQVSGLRVRKGNIQIGDNKTLDIVFSETRYNRYFIGEIYIFDDTLIPNARRDHFKKNESYFAFEQEVKKTTKEKLSKWIRSVANERTKENKINKIDQKIKDNEEKLSSGITTTEKENILAEVKELKKEAEQIKPKPLEKTVNNDLNQRLDNLESKALSSTNFFTKRLSSSMPRECRRYMGTAFEVITREIVDAGQARELINHIIEELQPKGRNKR